MGNASAVREWSKWGKGSEGRGSWRGVRRSHTYASINFILNVEMLHASMKMVLLP